MQRGAYVALHSFFPAWPTSCLSCITVFRNSSFKIFIMGSSCQKFALHSIQRKGFFLSQLFPLLLEIIEHEQRKGTYRQYASKPHLRAPTDLTLLCAQDNGIFHQTFLCFFTLKTILKKKKHSTKSISELLQRLIKQNHAKRKRVKT